jgi:hypothetical protein
MDIRGRANVPDFYRKQWACINEALEISFYCADAAGAAAEVLSKLRCVKDNNETPVFGRAQKAGEVQRVRGCGLHALNARGPSTETRGAQLEVVQPWRLEAT